MSATLVHCRIGSLEIGNVAARHMHVVHCRIGSLENHRSGHRRGIVVHCRIGSLEIEAIIAACGNVRSLPHRQLRK